MNKFQPCSWLNVGSTLVTLAFLIAVLVGYVKTPVCAQENTKSDSNPNTGLHVDFVSGNLSVPYMQSFWGEDGLSTSSAWKEGADRGDSVSAYVGLRKDGLTSVEDYVAWFALEPVEGQFNWTYYDQNYEKLKKMGINYSVYSWIGYAPKWFMATEDYVPYRCLEHGLDAYMLSTWAPSTLEVYDRYYRVLREHFGDRIDRIYIAAPADYGEIGYPAGMAAWVVPQMHIHEGFWCGDKYARDSFRDFALRKYGDVQRVNTAWNTSFSTREDITYPKPYDLSQRMYWMDFVTWYHESMTHFTEKVIRIVRKYFPDTTIGVKLGYGTEKVTCGYDISGIAKVCAKYDVEMSFPGACGGFWISRFGSAARHYGAWKRTEPPGAVKNEHDEIARIFWDASGGIDTVFDYPGNPRDLFTRYGELVNGEQPVVDIAVFYPSTDHYINTPTSDPIRLIAGVSELRDLTDFDIVDEQMILDEALSKYRVLALFEGNIVREDVLEKIAEWIETGGRLVSYDFGSIETLEGDTCWYKELFEVNGFLSKLFRRNPYSKQGPDFGVLYRDWTKKVGDGYAVHYGVNWDDGLFRKSYAKVITDVAYNISEKAPFDAIGVCFDGEFDGVFVTKFGDYVLMYNSTDAQMSKEVHGRSIVLEPYSIVRHYTREE